jgi:hypothetical protein
MSSDTENLNSRTEKLGLALPGRTTYTTFFTRAMAHAARARVEPEQLFIMGSYAVEISLDFSRADEFQKSNQYMLAPELENFSAASCLSGQYLYAGSPRDDLLLPAQKAVLLGNVRKDLAGSEWTRLEVREWGLRASDN